MWSVCFSERGACLVADVGWGWDGNLQDGLGSCLASRPVWVALEWLRGERSEPAGEGYFGFVRSRFRIRVPQCGLGRQS